MDFFRTNMFVRLFQVRWHFHSITWDPFPRGPQGHDNLNIVLKHNWFSLVSCVLNVSLVYPFLHSLYKSWLYYDLNWYSTAVFKIKYFASILNLQVKSQTAENSQNFIMVLKYVLQLRNLMIQSMVQFHLRCYFCAPTSFHLNYPCYDYSTNFDYLKKREQ